MTSPDSPYGSTAVADSPAVNSPVPQRRGLGIASLVLAIIPVVVTLIFVVIAITAGMTDTTGWAILGWAILGAYVSVPLGVLLGGTAVGLGIAAVAKRRGRALGIAGIVIGGLSLLSVLGFVVNIFFSAAL